MSATEELTYSDVSAHTTKKDLFVVIHDKIYNASSFVDEHPGGEEVLLDVGGQDATEAFEDVGHSDEAREILEGLLIGNLKRQAGDPSPKVSNSTATSTQAKDTAASFGLATYGSVLLAGAVAFFVYQYFMASEKK